MDFHSLARRDLQFLCKKNRVPANLTNVAMAKALEALETVEGIEEIQEALGFQSPRVNSPELPRTGRRTYSRGVTDGDEPKIQQPQQPIPLPQLHGVTIKTLEITEMASKEADIEETLGIQSLNLTSPELPRTGRMTSVRRAALEDEPKIQHQKPSPLYRSRQAAAKDLEVTEMASKEEEMKNKEIPTILSKTPATRNATKVVEAHSSNRRTKKNKEIESHTETPTAVEAKGGKAIGVATRRSTRLSSRKALEETATIQSKSRSSIRENSAVKMEPLAKEDTEEQEKEEKKEDRVEYGDSCAVIVSSMATRRSTRLSSRKVLEGTATAHSKSRSSSRENSAVKMESLAKEDTEEQEKEEKKEDRVEYGDSCAVIVEEHGKKDQEAGSNEFSSYINGENSKNEVENESEAIHEYAPMIQQQQPSLRPRSHKVTTKAREVTKMAAKEVDDKKKAPKLLPNTRGNTRLSSRKTVEERSGEQETVKMVALTEEYAEQQAEQNEKRDLSERSDSCVVDPVEENHGYSCSIEVEKGESIVALVEEVEENGKEVEIIGFSSSAQREDTNNEVEDGDSAVVIVEGDAKNDQELEIQAFSSPIEGENSNVERKNDDSDVVLVEEEGRNDHGENHGLSVLGAENSQVEVSEAFESKEDSGDWPPVSEYVKDSSGQSPENEFAEVSGDLLPANGAMEDSCDHSSDAKLAISAVSDSLFYGQMRPLLHEEATVCTQGYSKIDEEEEGKLSMLFTEMTLKEPEDAPLEPVASHFASFVPTKLPAATLIPQYADLVANADIVIPQDGRSSPDLPPALYIPPLYSENVDAITNLGNEISATEAITESPEEVQESSSVLPSKIAAVTEESIDDIPVSYPELCSGFSTIASTIELASVDHLREIPDESVEDNFHKHATNQSFEVPQKTEISQCGSFEQHSSVSSAELCSEFSTVHSSTAEIDPATDAPTMSSTPKFPCESESMSLEELPIVQTQSFEETGMAVTETKALDKEVFLKDENLELLSLTKLRAMYKQILNGTKAEQRKESIMKQEDLERLSSIKQDENCKQKLNDDMIKQDENCKQKLNDDMIKQDENCEQKLNDDMVKSGSKISVIKQEDLECLSRSKLDSNKQKLNDDKIKSERKRTPLKSLNYSTF